MTDLAVKLEKFAKRTIFNLAMNQKMDHRNYNNTQKINIVNCLERFDYSIDDYISFSVSRLIEGINVTIEDYQNDKEYDVDELNSALFQAFIDNLNLYEILNLHADKQDALQEELINIVLN